MVVIAGWSSTGCHYIFKTFHWCFVNIQFKSPARNGDLKSMSFVHIVKSILVNDSFFGPSFFFANNINTSVRSFDFSLLTKVLYIWNGPLSMFQPGAPHNLNPPLNKTKCDLQNKLKWFVSHIFKLFRKPLKIPKSLKRIRSSNLEVPNLGQNP